MKIEGWKYYNHAAIPTCAPHEKPDLAPVKDGRIWHLGGGKILFSRYTMYFDKQEETPFWYIIKDGPFVFEDLDAKYRRSVRKALERCDVRQIRPLDYARELWEVNRAAYSKYQNADNEQSEKEFIHELETTTCEYWAAFSKENGELVGWICCYNFKDYAETKKAKYHPEFQNLRPSDALHYNVLNHYLNELGKRYVLSGARNLNHKTNVQEYEIKNWKYRRAYCNLFVEYRPSLKWVVKVLYLGKALFRILDKLPGVHVLNSVLLQEEIARQCSKTGTDDS